MPILMICAFFMTLIQDDIRKCGQDALSWASTFYAAMRRAVISLSIVLSSVLSPNAPAQTFQSGTPPSADAVGGKLRLYSMPSKTALWPLIESKPFMDAIRSLTK